MSTQLGKKGPAKGSDPVTTVLWMVMGAAAGVGAYFLLKPSPRPQGSPTPPVGPGPSIPGQLPPTVPPSGYANIGAVAARLDEVITLWRSGTFGVVDTLSEAETLIDAIATLRAAGIGEENTAIILLGRIDDLKQSVSDWIDLHPEAELV